MLYSKKNHLIKGLIVSAGFGTVLMLIMLFFLGRHIILRPYKSLIETQQAIALAVEGISRIDTEGRYISLNAAYANAAGYQPEELQQQPWSATVYPEDLPELQNAYQEMLDTGKVTAEVRGIKKDGSIFYKQVTMVSQYHDDIFVGHHCFMKDISEKKQVEIEREKLIDQLVDSNEWLEQFAFACSHDLQEPLRMVRVFSGKLQEVLQGVEITDEKVHHYLKYVLDGSIRAQTLISDILTYSRIDRDLEQLQSIDVKALLAMLVDEFEVMLEGREIQLTFVDLPVIVGNTTQFYQLFHNLLSNALKYQKTGATPCVEIGAEDQGNYCQFYVRDNGIGIDTRYIEKVFDVFKRLHTQSEYSGSGVGLAICKKMVMRHGGLIWADSTVGIGSTFYFTILKSTTKENE